jgi:TPR repeat protein
VNRNLVLAGILAVVGTVLLGYVFWSSLRRPVKQRTLREIYAVSPSQIQQLTETALQQNDGTSAFLLYRHYEIASSATNAPELAKYWLKRACELGNEMARYQVNFDKHKLTFEEHELLTKRAIKESDAAAALRLFHYYDKCMHNDTKALEWLEKAAASGDTNAMKLLNSVKGVNSKAVEGGRP